MFLLSIISLSLIDASVMLSLKKTFNSPINLEWSDPDPCKWNHVVCSEEKRVTRIQIGHKNLQGTLPLNLSVLTQLERLELQWNNISGPLPSLSGLSSLQLLMLSNNLFTSLSWVNGQRSKMSGGIDVIKNMTILNEIWLHSNSFLGPLPDFSSLKNLESLSLRDNSFTGHIPISLVNLESLKVVNLTNNFLQGPMPEFKSLVKVDMTKKTNSFCLDEPGNCDSRVNSLLSIVKSMGYPLKFGENWKGNDPCADRPSEKILTTK